MDLEALQSNIFVIFLLGIGTGVVLSNLMRKQRDSTPLKPLSPAGSAKIQQLLQSQQKIEALKLYRQETGASLRDAKDYIENIRS